MNPPALVVFGTAVDAISSARVGEEPAIDVAYQASEKLSSLHAVHILSFDDFYEIKSPHSELWNRSIRRWEVLAT